MASRSPLSWGRLSGEGASVARGMWQGRPAGWGVGRGSRPPYGGGRWYHAGPRAGASSSDFEECARPARAGTLPRARRGRYFFRSLPPPSAPPSHAGPVRRRGCLPGSSTGRAPGFGPGGWRFESSPGSPFAKGEWGWGGRERDGSSPLSPSPFHPLSRRRRGSTTANSPSRSSRAGASRPSPRPPPPRPAGPRLFPPHPHSLPPYLTPKAMLDHRDLPIPLFAGRSNPALAAAIAAEAGRPLGRVTIRNFADGEVYVRYEESIRGSDLFIIQSTPPPAETWMELLLMVDAARRASAARITAVIPYFGYARQDRKDQPRVSIAARMLAKMLEQAGVERVL